MNEELDGTLSTKITLSSNALKSGLMDELTPKEIKFFKLTDAGSHKLNNLEIKYTRSYTSNPSRTVLHWRDLLLSWTISLLLRNCLSFDIKNSKLTTQAYHYYRNNDGSEIWREDLWNIKKDKVYSSFGSLSYFFKDVSVDLNYPVSACNTLTKHLLSLYSFGDSYKELHDNYVNFLLSTKDLDSLESTLSRIQKEEILRPEKLKFIRRNLLVEEDWSNLSMRVLMGEYRKELLTLIDYEEYEDKLFKRVRPLGSVGFYLLLIADNLIEICKRITNSPTELQNTDLYDFFDSKDNSIKEPIYNNLSVASYACYYLQFFNTLEESRRTFNQIKELMFLLNLNDYNPPNNYKLF